MELVAKMFSFEKKLSVVGLLLILLQCASAETLPRGVGRSMGSFYKPGSTFSCRDGSQTIPFDQINDDYCDCADGSDEPGTSACRNGKFYCINKGYKPEIIPSSRVSDGVCDCCDGSDEYEGKASCEDTCIELGKSMREELEASRRIIEEGHRIRSEYSVQGKQAKAEKQSQLVTLGPKRDELQKTKDEVQSLKEAAEEPEKAAKEVHESWWKEQLALKEAEKDKVKAGEAFLALDTSQDGLITMVELQARDEFDTNKDGHVSEEEMTLLLGDALDGADLEQFTSNVWPKIKDIYKAPEPDTPEPIEAPPTEPEETTGGSDDDDADFDEEDFEDGDDNEDDDRDLPPTRPSDENLMPAYPDETQALIRAADAAREAYKKVEDEFNQVNNEIADIEKFLAQDLGPDDVFYPLRGECFEYTDREYTYKFCPFDKASQRPKAGGAETNLGTFSTWEPLNGETYGLMKFEKGLHCWNGPDRSATVKFICGKENELANAAEPNRCEYSFDFTTPAACHNLPEGDLDSVDHTHTEL